MLRKTMCLFTALILLLGMHAQACTRSELRAAWQEIAALRSDASPYREQPDPAAFSAGSLTDEALADALNCLNFLRKIAGLDAVQLSSLYTLRAQNGAMLLAANDFLEHNAPQPAGMDDEQYRSAHMGTAQANIAKFNWMKPDILIDGVTYFARDDGEINLSVLGHRRWLLNPHMAETGFGLANAQSGISYISMYAVDMGNSDAGWDYIAWPAAEAFPVEMMRANLPWSVSLNDEIYDISASRPQVYLKEEISGAEFSFDIAAGTGDGYCTLSREPYGTGSCIIFRPEIADRGIGEYVQNQIWTVAITGLKYADGSPAEISYSCEMASLYPQDPVNVELSVPEITLQIGESMHLQAQVIPAYADDLSVSWESSDPEIATVGAGGIVLAVAPGQCTITASSINGRSDSCTVTVQ